MIHQLLTAKLNCGQFSCTATAELLINTCDEAYATGNVTEIQMVDTIFPGSGCTEELDYYNNSGEIDYPFPPGASPSLSRILANTIVDLPDAHENKTGIERWDNVYPTSDEDGDGLSNWFEVNVFPFTDPYDPNDPWAIILP
jgi:hypothetical protein